MRWLSVPVLFAVAILSTWIGPMSAEESRPAVCKDKDTKGQIPKWRSNGLTLCSRFEKMTCCSRKQTDALYLQWKAGAVAGFSPACQHAYETGLCFSCDPRVGVGILDKICKRTCDQWYEACKDEFFSAVSVPGQSLEPCVGDAVVCSPLHSFISSGSELCTELGYNIAADFCYDGTADPNLEGKKERVTPRSPPNTPKQNGLFPAIVSNSIDYIEQLHPATRTNIMIAISAMILASIILVFTSSSSSASNGHGHVLGSS